MNTNFNNKFVNLSKNLFEKFTEDGEYIFGSGGVFNPETGDYTETNNTIKISCRKGYPYATLSKGELDAGLAEKDDNIILTAGVYFKNNKPLIGNKIKIQNETFSIKNIIEIKSVYDVAMYKFICGKA